MESRELAPRRQALVQITQTNEMHNFETEASTYGELKNELGIRGVDFSEAGHVIKTRGIGSGSNIASEPFVEVTAMESQLPTSNFAMVVSPGKSSFGK